MDPFFTRTVRLGAVGCVCRRHAVYRDAPEGGLWLYYIGSNEAGDHQVADEMILQHQIGLACCDGKDLTRWRRLGEV
jgi:hypothetical protein